MPHTDNTEDRTAILQSVTTHLENAEEVEYYETPLDGDVLVVLEMVVKS